ncbi:hypothetical protein BDW72DRAFT_175068 [Aspergillus terricola var. indicus]
MGQGDSDKISRSNPDRFRTPDKPASSGKLTRVPARLGVGSLAVTPGTSSTSTATSTPSTASTSSGNSKSNTAPDQTTLTQIDFVKKSQPDYDDDVFKYIGRSGSNAREVIEINDDEPDNPNDKDYRPSSSRIKRKSRVRLGSAPSNLKKGSVQGDKISRKGRRKSGNDKRAQNDDNTLTQMKYVQLIDLESDDGDAKLEYAYLTSKKRDPELRSASTGEHGKIKQQPTYISEPSSEHKRRKLSPSSAMGEPCQTKVKPEEKVEFLPSTPQKPLRTEIPSSQSPESPGVAFITSSQFRNAARSPERWPLTFSKEISIKEELRSSLEKGGASGTAQTPLIDKNQPIHNNSRQLSPSARRASAEGTPKATELKKSVADAPAASNPRQRPAQRTVVYETDAESDYDGFEDDMQDAPSSSKDTDIAVYETHVENELNSPVIESQELPPPPVSDKEPDSNPFSSESTLLSEASICYRRVHPNTQFPLEPVPTINTQKLAELFPEDSNGLRTLTPTPSSSPMKAPLTSNAPIMVSETQSLDQNLPDSQDRSRTPTDIVPESSPAARHEDSVPLNRHGPPARNVEVQVESSQPVDRADRRRTAGQDSAPRAMLSRSQILTSSVMESIPIPGLWMSSQDSVGEPYN